MYRFILKHLVYTLAGDYANNYDPTYQTTTYDIGCVQNQQSRDIIFNYPFPRI